MTIASFFVWLGLFTASFAGAVALADGAAGGDSGAASSRNAASSEEASVGPFGAIDDPVRLHRRAVGHDIWMRERLMPAGGVMAALFTDQTLTEVDTYIGRRDPAIWTGAYLAAQALRLMATGAEDAAAQVAETTRVLSRWWRISGDPGYLARFAAPAESPSAVLGALSADDPEVIRDVPFEGALWHWRGRVSRDQYQGVLLGVSLAYEATADPEIRQLIREDVTAFAEQLMRRERRRVKVIIDDGANFSTTLTLQHVVYTDNETPDGQPVLRIRTNPFSAEGSGLLVFWPNPAEVARQIPGLGWLPDVLLPSQAIQLAATFRVAMQVTHGVPGYEAHYQAFRHHYEAHLGRWFDIARGWENRNPCGDSYHGLNIAFLPMYNWVRLETDPGRRARLQREVLRDRLWTAVADHKNVLFAFLYAAAAHPEDALDAIIEDHLAQLAQFPAAPQLARAFDVSDRYPADPTCPGLAAEATDVAHRAAATFIWERHPWRLADADAPNVAYSGVDYLLAYWLGRQAGFIAGIPPDRIGLHDEQAGRFYLHNQLSPGPADIRFGFGPTDRGWLPVAGDWNGDGRSTVGLYDPHTGAFHLRDQHVGGVADHRFAFGPPARGWLPIAGDWNGNGRDTIGLYDPHTGTFYLRNGLAGGAADHRFPFGPPARGWLPIAGDWNGDGHDTVGLYDPHTGTFYLRNVLAGGGADHRFPFGPAAVDWFPVVGDWNGDGRATVGLFEPWAGIFHLQHAHIGGPASVRFRFGPAPSRWTPLVGRWTQPVAW